MAKAQGVQSSLCSYNASIAVIGVAIGMYRFQFVHNICINFKVGTAGVLDNLAGEKYSEQFLGMFV